MNRFAAPLAFALMSTPAFALDGEAANSDIAPAFETMENLSSHARRSGSSAVVVSSSRSRSSRPSSSRATSSRSSSSRATSSRSSSSRATSSRSSNGRTVTASRSSSQSRASSSRSTVRSSGSRTTTVVRRPASRPGSRTVVVHSSGARHLPARPAARPAPRRVYTAPAPTRVVRVTRARPYHGVFVYGPRPVYHVNYTSPTPVAVQKEHLPTRNVERANTMAVGFTAGTNMSITPGGNAAYADFGMGGMARYRPSEGFGLEGRVHYFDDSWGQSSSRDMVTGQVSAQAFITPWSTVSPYLTGGMTISGVDVEGVVPGVGVVDEKAVLFGPHAGVGLEIGFGRFAVDADVRYTHYINAAPMISTAPGSLQTTVNLITHF